MRTPTSVWEMVEVVPCNILLAWHLWGRHASSQQRRSTIYRVHIFIDHKSGLIHSVRIFKQSGSCDLVPILIQLGDRRVL